jgi:hypothetical protein
MDAVRIHLQNHTYHDDATLDELVYNVTVDQIHLDQQSDSTPGAVPHVPAITLCYGPDTIKPARRIVQETARQGRAPEVYVQNHGDSSDLVVVFRVRPISARFLRGLMPKGDRVQYQKKMTKQTSLVLVAGGTVPKDKMEPFLGLYEQAKSFVLNVALRFDSVSKQLWGTRLTALIEGAPSGWGS